jgi:predicted nucleotidyltransferase component of viral defense system
MEGKKVPLHRRIRRERHKKIARLQDILVETLYRVFPRGVLHGGTAIWRCYSGNRFSEDVDMYLQKDIEKINRFFEELKRAGFGIIKKRITKNSIYSSLGFGEVEVRFEALFKRARGVVKEYETYEGILFNVFTLTPEEMIDEKIDAYLKRRKVRDLYDIFFLLRYAKKDERLKAGLTKLLRNFVEPVDKEELKALIMFGAIPTTKDMLEYMERWTV